MTKVLMVPAQMRVTATVLERAADRLRDASDRVRRLRIEPEPVEAPSVWEDVGAVVNPVLAASRARAEWEYREAKRKAELEARQMEEQARSSVTGLDALADQLQSMAPDLRRRALIAEMGAGPAAIARLGRLVALARTLGARGTILGRGSNGVDVVRLQRMLKLAGIDVDADGAYGPKTALAVERFQHRYGLGADGVVGPKTWSRIAGSLAARRVNLLAIAAGALRAQTAAGASMDGAESRRVLAWIHAQRMSHGEKTILRGLVDAGLTREQLGELLAGGHVVIDDDGDLAKAWAKLDDAEKRQSSHYSKDSPYLPNVVEAPMRNIHQQYGLHGKLFTEVLFGRTGDGRTFIQMENHTTGQWYGHNVEDFRSYKDTGMNVGPDGISPHTEHHDPIVLHPHRGDAK